jgi:hypothetical protein
LYLSCADEQDWLSGDIGHRDGGADLVVDGVKLAEDNTIDPSRVGDSGKVLQRAVEFDELIYSFVADEGFADKDDLIRIVDRDELVRG